MASQTIQTVFFDLGDTLVKVPKVWLPGADALLQSLKSRGYRLGIISNTPGLTSRAAIFGLLPDDFDINLFKPALVLFSSEVGLEKPNPEIFEKAVERAGHAAGECLYCSENLVETLVAQHAGLLSIRVQTAPNSDLDTIEEKLDKFHSLI
jgi:FMN phosphatase YigB (HAD superfamily)